MSEYTILNNDRDRLGVFEHEVHKFTAEASMLGFPPGRFPTKILTDMGNGQPFIMERFEQDDDDIHWVFYRQCLGCITLKVFND